LLSNDIHTQAVMRAICALPFISLGEIFQEIDTQRKGVITHVNVAATIKIRLSTVGKFQMKSARQTDAKRYARFKSYGETPPPFAAQVPESVTVEGTEIDLSATNGPTNMIQDAVLDVMRRITQHILQLGAAEETMCLNTVLHDHIRVCRVNSGILVFQRCPGPGV
jgi:hypothetical protein